MALVLLIGGWLGWAIHRARAQREAVAALKRVTAHVRFRHDGKQLLSGDHTTPAWLSGWVDDEFFREVDLVNFTYSVPTSAGMRPELEDALAHLEGLSALRFLELHGETATDSALAHIRGLTSLEALRVEWHADGVTDAGIAHLEGLKNLRSLWIQGTRMTDAGLARLENLTRLEMLLIDRNPITDAGLARLGRHKALKVLLVGGAQAVQGDVLLRKVRSDGITDAGLVHLEGMADLGVLGLEGTGVTDRGLRHLEKLRKLTDLYINETRITDDGARSLQRSLPGLKIHRERFSIEAPEIPPPPDAGEVSGSAAGSRGPRAGHAEGPEA
jgi:hypothetical protein